MPATQDLAAPHQIEQALKSVKDQASFIQRLLIDALQWPIGDKVERIEDISYGWNQDELRAEGLDNHLLDGRIWQIQLKSNQPWGVFLLEFKSPDAFVTGRGVVGPLRKVLRGLVPSRRKTAHAKSWQREHLLFLCTHNYSHFRVGYFKSPVNKTAAAPLAAFGWGPDVPARTACEFNLPPLTWPDGSTGDAWVKQWASAFDVEKVTKRFYEHYSQIFTEVERLIGNRSGLKSAEDLRMFTQTLFNRLMFLRFIERKGWLEFQGRHDYLRALFQAGGIGGKSLYQSRLRQLFFQGLAVEGQQKLDAVGKVPFLNGGLFEENDLDRQAKDVPDNGLSPMLGSEGLFYRYNFTIEESTPLDIEVAVDPEMLGKVFEELVTGRHETGSYYTPRPIVAYMCRESLKGFLTEKTTAPPEAVAKLVGEHTIDGLNDAHAREILAALDGLRAVDPACGSGAYLLGLLHELVAIYRLLYSERLVRDPRSLYDLKLRIISRNLFGVDIDPFATNIAMLRLWLSLAVEANEPIALPNLDFKIETGDSLVGPCEIRARGLDYERTLRDRADRLVALKDEYMNAHGETKITLRKGILAEEAAIADELHARVGRGVIDWRIHFAEAFVGANGGFDIALANPPYISALEFKRRYSDDYRDALNRMYSTAKGAYDIYILFYERAIQCLKPGGMLCFITPNKYLAAKYAVALREFLIKGTQLCQLVDISRVPVFESAAVYPVVTLIRKRSTPTYRVTLLHPPRTAIGSFDMDEYVRADVESASLRILPELIWGFLLSDQLPLLTKMLNGTVPLSTLCEVNATTSAAEADEFGGYLRDGVEKNSFKVVNTGTIEPYICLWGRARMTHAGERFLRPFLPRSAVNERRRQMYGKPKIIFSKMAKACEAFFDLNGEYASLNTNCVYDPRDGMRLEYICAYCNSRTFMFLYGQLFGALRMSGGYFQFQAPQLRVMPIRQLESAAQKGFIEAVARILQVVESGKDSASETVSRIRDELDERFCDLFDLNEEERSIIRSVEIKEIDLSA